MSFEKVTYKSGETVITADNLNAIQDELIRVAGLLGKDIQSAAINDSGHLILTLTDGTTLDAGVAKGAKGDTGATGPQGPAGAGMDITGATVGQIAKIAAVDSDGKPTTWSPVDMPTGGGVETWELIKHIKTTEAVNEIRINADDIGEPFELEEAQIYTKLYLQGDASASIRIRLHNSINGSTAHYAWPFIAASDSIKSDTSAGYPAVYAGYFKQKDYTINNNKYWMADTWSASSAGTSTVAGVVNRLDFLCQGTYETHVMDAVRCVMISANNGAVQIGANSEIWIFGKRRKVT